MRGSPATAAEISTVYRQCTALCRVHRVLYTAARQDGSSSSGGGGGGGASVWLVVRGASVARQLGSVGHRAVQTYSGTIDLPGYVYSVLDIDLDLVLLSTISYNRLIHCIPP